LPVDPDIAIARHRRLLENAQSACNDRLSAVHRENMRANAMTHRTASARRTLRARDERLEARISRDQKALFQRAAELQGRTLTDFVIASVHDAAVRTIEDMRTIRLNAKESRAFAESLLDPREPTARLNAAARHYLRMLGE
jgi:uncharacterized protein (DUF1778 family)